MIQLLIVLILVMGVVTLASLHYASKIVKKADKPEEAVDEDDSVQLSIELAIGEEDDQEDWGKDDWAIDYDWDRENDTFIKIAQGKDRNGLVKLIEEYKTSMANFEAEGIKRTKKGMDNIAASSFQSSMDFKKRILKLEGILARSDKKAA
jgi:hypothetical protein